MDLLSILLLNKLKNQGGKTPTGSISITSNGEYNVTDYATANVNVVSDVVVPDGMKFMKSSVVLNNLDTSNVTDFSYMFSQTTLTTIPSIDTSKGTNFEACFSNSKSLTSVPLIDTSKATSLKQMFQSCNHLTSIPALDTSSSEQCPQFCSSCTLLTDVPIMNWHNVTNIQNAFSGCSALTETSLNNILKTISDTSTNLGYRDLKYLGLTSEQATTCTGLSNWADCQTAGWTTGY